MNAASRRIQNTYLILSLLIWLPTALIFGVNTLFLLDAGLSNVEAFAANAFYTAGLLIFEIPTGMVADSWGRRTSFLLGVGTQFIANLMYVYMWYIHGPFWGWALASVLLGFGYTFFSGALEAWLVDSLKHTKHKGDLDSIFAKGQTINGIGMLVGTVAGGFIAQISALGVPYLVRGAIQLISFVVAFIIMKEVGFTPERVPGVIKQVKTLLRASVQFGFRNRPVRWVMLAGPFLAGTTIFAFYAAQPYLLELFGDKQAIGIAGIAAAVIAGTQIVGGLIAPSVRKLFKRRTDVLIAGSALTVASLVLIGTIHNFYVAIGLLVLWALAFAATMPVRQAYINNLIPSKQRATVLSFDSMVSSVGGVVFQPMLGRVADVTSYAASFVVSGIVASCSLPFLLAARHEKVASDTAHNSEPQPDK
jgi:MFS family permease